MHVHGHSPTLGRRLRWSLAITVVFIVVELGAGVTASSLALLADAGHNFTDSLALLLAWFAFVWQSRPPDESRTFGYHRAGVLAAFVNALSLIGVALLIFYESYRRFLSPRAVDETIMIVVAAAGIAVNLLVMKLLHADSRDDLSIRVAFLHMAGDALSSAGIIVGAAVIAFTDLYWIDPLVSCLIAALIFWSSWGVLRESLNILLEGLPKDIERNAVREALIGVEGVLDVHDLHIWSLSSSARALSCHALIADLPPSESQAVLARINRLLRKKFHIRHATVQFEHVECDAAGGICTEHGAVGGVEAGTGRGVNG